ncbi:hypothetical protein F4774DRAFT_412676 [Daldinia eschscholtzii]|nr:hypothetical protein F4774DRAFT_412676 [Daldinia eschscholtzii]
MRFVPKVFTKIVIKATIYGIIAIGTLEALRKFPSVKMMRILMREKKAWGPTQAEKDGILDYVQLFFISWWHYTVRAPAKYIAKQFKAVVGKAKQSHIGTWITRKGKKKNNVESGPTEPRRPERVSAFREMFDEAIYENTADSSHSCLPQAIAEADDPTRDW